MTDTIESVAHVAPTVVADPLRELGAEHLIEFYDVLSHGPSRSDPKDHRGARLDHWRQLYRRVLADSDPESHNTFEGALHELEESYLSTEQLGSVASNWADQRRLVVWTTPAFQDRLFMWMVFDALQQADISAERVATAEPRLPSPDGEGHAPLRDMGPAELIGGFEEIFYPEDLYVDAGAQLWQTFTSASPRKFAISIPHTEKFFPNIETLGERYGWMFPVQHGEDSTCMWPSQFDAKLLGALDRGRWQTTLEVLGADFVERFHFVDDLAIAARLRDWADEAESTSYIRARESDRNDFFERREFTLTERGERLLEEGFEPFDDAPIWEIGSARAYAGDRPWVKVIEDEYWWFERFERDDGVDG